MVSLPRELSAARLAPSTAAAEQREQKEKKEEEGSYTCTSVYVGSRCVCSKMTFRLLEPALFLRKSSPSVSEALSPIRLHRRWHSKSLTHACIHNGPITANGDTTPYLTITSVRA